MLMNAIRGLLGACWLRCVLAILFLTSLGVPVFSRLWTEAMTRPYIVPIDQAPTMEVAVVFGAGVYRDGRPSRALRSRLETALRLYQQGKVRRLILSGSPHYHGNRDEVRAMAVYLIERGVPVEALLLDPKGVRTYATCRQLGETFRVRRALLVTHRYHLPRALILCHAWGVDAIGVPSVAHRPAPWRERVLFWYGRESLATVRALLDLLWLEPPPSILSHLEPSS